ncbi:MAG: DNA mismatch repair protein MutS [Gemmatimonadota bacterium]|nr:DNA mismatch repair protein MutS [Gemmatimonadota bacterium]
MISAASDTPLIQQWREVKSRHPDAIVFFRVGDFYEMFNEDAEEGARLLGLTLTSRNNGSSRAPLAGVPAHAVSTYLQRLVALGRRVAVCEQVEDPAMAKGLVRREVTEMVTPGVLLNGELLDGRRNNHLVVVAGGPAGDAPLGLACADLSTGELRLRAVPPAALDAALEAAEASEVLLAGEWEGCVPPGAASATQTFRPSWFFDPVGGREALCRRLGVGTLDGFGIEPRDAPLVAAWGALSAYLAEVQPGGCDHIRAPRIERGVEGMPLDAMTRRNLELVEPLRGDERSGTLLTLLDEAATPMGSRLLRRWLLGPLLCRRSIDARLDAVAEIVADAELRAELRACLGEIRDLERLGVRAAAGRSTPRELLALGNSLRRGPELRAMLLDVVAPLLQEHREGLDPLEALARRLECGLERDLPAALADGGVIRVGFHPELDELRAARDGAVEWIAGLQARERERTGIASLKVGFNRVFGYYLEVTRTHLQKVPDDYHRKQTLANAERFFTPELKEWEARVLGAEERIGALEQALFAELRAEVGREVGRVQALADHVARLDVLATFAEVSVRREYVRPHFHDGYELRLAGARHAVVESLMPRDAFIPNDVVLDGSGRVMILTGPNMAGKSTVLRQVGLIVLLAQIGCFVPAREAHLPVVDRVFTRVGASDHLARGQSTFMVEMHETAAILHGATDRSLVLLDEIGRGTSTWDGLSVATAVTEHLRDVVGAKTMFATHYHELTELAAGANGVVNFSVAVRESGEEIVFLRRLVPGGADRSYGVEAARLAGMPAPVVARARALLRQREAESPAAGCRPAAVQIGMFPPDPHPVVARLRSMDPNQFTPLQALQLLAELRDALDLEGG